MKDDYVTKEELLKTEQLIRSDFEKVRDELKSEIRGVGIMVERLENTISSLAELIAPNAERPIRNEERLDQHETILQKHDVEIKVLQQTK